MNNDNYSESLDPNLRKAGSIPRISPLKQSYNAPYIEYVPGSRNVIREQRDFDNQGK